MKVLVVDDSPMVRKKMQEILEEIGHSVILASNGKEAIKMYQEQHPDIITMDLAMPVMSGMDALKRLIEIEPSVKVIVSTSDGCTDSALLAMKEGASGYIIKPIQIETLKSAIDNAYEDIKIGEDELL